MVGKTEEEKQMDKKGVLWCVCVFQGEGGCRMCVIILLLSLFLAGMTTARFM